MKTITALSAALVTLALAPAAGAYTFTTIDHPASAGLTYALALDSQARVAGAYIGLDGMFHGYVLSNGVYRAVDYPGAAQTVVGGIEDNGRITGTYIDAQGFQHGYKSIAGQFFPIDVPGAGQISDVVFEFGPGLGTAAVHTAHDLTIGWYATPDGKEHGFVRDHGVFQTLDVPGGILDFPGHGTQPIALNDQGVIGGSYVQFTSPPVHGFLYENGAFTTFDVPGAGGSFGTQVNGINNHGDVVGPYTDDSDVLHGFVYAGGQLTTVDVPGAVFSEVDSINDAGVITGEWYGADGVVHGFVATP